MANLIAYELLPRIFNMSVTAGIVILFVLLARLLLRRAPKVFSYALWSVVLFRLLCPVSLSAGFSLLGLVDMPTRAATPHTTTVEYVPPDIVHAEDPQVQFPVEPVRTAVNEVLPKGKNRPRPILWRLRRPSPPGSGCWESWPWPHTAWHPTSKYGAGWSAPCRCGTISIWRTTSPPPS